MKDVALAKDSQAMQNASQKVTDYEALVYKEYEVVTERILGEEGFFKMSRHKSETSFHIMSASSELSQLRVIYNNLLGSLKLPVSSSSFTVKDLCEQLLNFSQIILKTSR